jgi:hypothetical protein
LTNLVRFNNTVKKFYALLIFFISKKIDLIRSKTRAINYWVVIVVKEEKIYFNYINVHVAFCVYFDFFIKVNKDASVMLCLFIFYFNILKRFKK